MSFADESDEWNIHLSTVFLTQCEQCQEVKPCELLEDPYLAEIYPDPGNQEQYWCKLCYYRRVCEI